LVGVAAFVRRRRFFVKIAAVRVLGRAVAASARRPTLVLRVAVVFLVLHVAAVILVLHVVAVLVLCCCVSPLC
jgi:hypothetical protein